MLRHKLVHSDAQPYSCSICGSKFKTSSAYLLHVRERHASSAHACVVCGLSFTQKRALDRHMLCHSDQMHHGCSLCGYRCRRKQDLHRHIRAMHSGKPRRRRHEENLAAFFTDQLQTSFTREFTVKASTFAGRKFARIDFHISMPWGWLLFECDEMAHCSYSISDECQRMAPIWEFFRRNCPDLNLHIVRYNSHAFKQDRAMIKPTQE